ncbi:MAG: YlxR family protein [Chloroflexi bacterium]|nr:MAG: YlxR family protein [Chloroflexota bacterium]
MKRTVRSSEAKRSAPSGTKSRGALPPARRAGGSSGGQAARTLPQRTCVACRTTRPKRELVRVVRSPLGELSVDLRGKAPGRGAYLDPDAGCLERGLAEGALSRALEIPIDEGAAAKLRTELAAAAKERRTNA